MNSGHVIALEPRLSPKEVAGILGISERSAIRLMLTGELEAFRVGRLWRTTRAKLLAYEKRESERWRPRLAA